MSYSEKWERLDDRQVALVSLLLPAVLWFAGELEL